MPPPDGQGPVGPAEAGYRPPRFLRDADVQAVLASCALRRRLVERRAVGLEHASEERILHCLDDVRLLAHHTPPATAGNRIAVLLHGWEGSARSLHVLSCATRLHAAGFRIVRLNLRDHGNSHHLNRGIFHSNRLDEVVDAVRRVHASWPEAALHLVGFSLGGNFALRIAAAIGRSLPLAKVIAVCPVLDPEETMHALDSGPAIYRWYFLGKWRRSLARKAALFPDDYVFGPLDRFTTLGAMTDYFVRRYTEFPDLTTYLRGYALTGPRLAGLQVPSTILLADDDPVIPVTAVERLARSPYLHVVRSRFGGHCGFLTDYRLRSWMDDYVLEAIGAP